ncbi:MAG: NlpC/P60 family protein [Ornithinimicrobium sp.]
MSHTAHARHRAPRRPTSPRLIRASAVTAASVGLIVSMATGSQAATSTTAASTPAASATTPAATALATLPLPTHSVSSTLKWGARGSAVKSVQRVVGTNVDGIFGPKTHAAVKRYQSRHGLTANGIVGSSTTRHMGLSSTGGSDRAQSSASRSSSRSTGSSASGVLGYAQQYTGIMYSWGGTSPSTGFDCSGYIAYVFGKAGINLPRTAEQQRQATTPVSQPRPGDLVFWGAPAWHNAIYAGDGMIYDSGKPGIPTQKRKMFSGVTSYGRVG